LYAKLSKCEF
jgi:hypothetical protein